jgi:hypothetical protein
MWRTSRRAARCARARHRVIAVRDRALHVPARAPRTMSLASGPAGAVGTWVATAVRNARALYGCD